MTDTKAHKVWELYKYYKEGLTTTIRSGFGSCGVYDFSKPFDYQRSESTAEHSLGAMMLVEFVYEKYPGMMTKEKKNEYKDILQYHELGEIKHGDISDDGTRDTETMDAVEFEEVKDFLHRLYKSSAALGKLHKFLAFQRKNTKFGYTLYMFDKTEAILQAMIYEKQGRGGDLKHKKNPSERDLLLWRITGSSKIVDCWSYAFNMETEGFENREIFLDIMSAAAQDVLHRDLSWKPQS